MSGINTGILINAKPLSTERIKELEKQVLEKQETFAYLDENSDLCFSMPRGVDNIKDLAWNNAYELSTEANSFTKKAYKKTGLKTFSLDKVLSKQNINDAWGEPERLEGDGQEFYTMAPSTLSFRSTAPLNELQDVQINGQTVDPSNYELEEGSTIVKLKYDYLSTLDVGQYELSVVSDSKTVKGDFTVAAPELNEYGFYYNQPYYAHVHTTTWDNQYAFILHEDGSASYVSLEGGYSSSSVAISCKDGVYTIAFDFLEFTGTFSDDGTSFLVTEIYRPAHDERYFNNFEFVLNNEVIASDGEYFYSRSLDDTSYWYVSPMDKTKGSYGQIKANILGAPVKEVGYRAFDGNDSITTIPVLPESIQVINSFAFYSCGNLSSIMLPYGVTTIGKQAFNHCTSLTSVTIPKSVTLIDFGAFGYCTSLTDISFGGSMDEWHTISKDSFWYDRKMELTITCTDGVVTLYPWVIPDGGMGGE